MLASVTTLLTTLALTVAAPQWESDYGKALAQTRSDSKPLLIVMDKPGVENQQINKELLNDSSEGAPLAKYDLCHVDVTTEYGQAVAEVFKADTFPYVAIIDKSGKEILHRHAGVVSTEGWSQMLTKHQGGDKAVRITAAKPVITESQSIFSDEPTTTIRFQSEPVVQGGSYYETTTPSYYAQPVAQPVSNCPNCQRNR